MTALTLTTEVGNAEKLLAELKLARWELYPPQTDGFNALGDLIDDLQVALADTRHTETPAVNLTA